LHYHPNALEDVTILLVFIGQKTNAEIIFYKRREMLIYKGVEKCRAEA